MSLTRLYRWGRGCFRVLPPSYHLQDFFVYTGNVSAQDYMNYRVNIRKPAVNRRPETNGEEKRWIPHQNCVCNKGPQEYLFKERLKWATLVYGSQLMWELRNTESNTRTIHKLPAFPFHPSGHVEVLKPGTPLHKL